MNIIFDSKDRSDLDNWLNNKKSIPEKILNIKTNSEYAFIMVFTNRINENIIDSTSKKDQFFLPVDGQSIKISKSTLSITELFKKNYNTIHSESHLKDGLSNKVFAECLDLFAVLDIGAHYAKNIKKYILNILENDPDYIICKESKAINYISLNKESKKILVENFVNDFIDYESSKKINYYYINYKDQMNKRKSSL
jgi:hypothetical protein